MQVPKEFIVVSDEIYFLLRGLIYSNLKQRSREALQQLLSEPDLLSADSKRELTISYTLNLSVGTLRAIIGKVRTKNLGK